MCKAAVNKQTIWGSIWIVNWYVESIFWNKRFCLHNRLNNVIYAFKLVWCGYGMLFKTLVYVFYEEAPEVISFKFVVVNRNYWIDSGRTCHNHFTIIVTCASMLTTQTECINFSQGWHSFACFKKGMVCRLGLSGYYSLLWPWTMTLLL